MPESKQHNLDGETSESAAPTPSDAESAPRPGEGEDATDATDATDAVDRLSKAVDDLDDASAKTGDGDEDVDELIAEVDSLEDAASTSATETASPSDEGDERASDAAPSSGSLSNGDDEVDPEALEALMDSDFDPAEEVLAAVFETKAALIQHGEETEVTIRQEMMPPPADDARPKAVDETPADASARNPVDDEHVTDGASDDDDPPDDPPEGASGQPANAEPELEADEASDESEDARAEDVRTEAGPIDESESVAEANPVKVNDAEPPPEPPPAPEPPPEPAPELEAQPVVSEPQPQPAAESTETAQPAAQAEAQTDVEEPEPSERKEPGFDLLRWLMAQLRQLLDRAMPMTRRALQTMNLPLRFVPPKLRPLVDYLALTLIMWVPIVWAIVWLVRQ